MNDTAEWLDMGLWDVAEMLRTGQVTSERLTILALERAKEIQPEVNCFIHIESEQAIAAAKAADLAVSRGDPVGPLHGVPLAHKDMFHRAGHFTTGGSKLFAQHRSTITATVAQRLQAAGAIWLGTLNMAEFAANPLGLNATYGDCRNAWNRECISGGSSSGSAVAVALRACYASLGSDTGGSVRIPAALNGITGLRPTYGRVSRYGIMPRTWSMDTVGPMARTARDCARILQVIAGPDPLDPTTSHLPVPDYEQQLTGDISGLRIAVPTNYFYDQIATDVRKVLEVSLKSLSELGARLVEVDTPDPARLYQLGNLISQVEAAAIHANLVQTAGDDYPLVLKTRMESGAYVPAVDYLAALSARARLLEAFTTTVFQQADALYTPAIGMAAPLLKDASPSVSADVFPLLALTARCTRPFSTLGVPALAVPAGFTPEGLPVAFQLAGRPHSEGLLLRIADAYQRLTDWHARKPPILES